MCLGPRLPQAEQTFWPLKVLQVIHVLRYQHLERPVTWRTPHALRDPHRPGTPVQRHSPRRCWERPGHGAEVARRTQEMGQVCMEKTEI